MKNILLIAKFNSVTRNAANYLKNHFQIQIANTDDNLVSGLLQMSGYDLILAILAEWDTNDIRLLEKLQQEYPDIPILCLGTTMELAQIDDIVKKGQMRVLRRPTQNQHLLDVISDELQMTPAETEPPKPEIPPKQNPEKKSERKPENRTKREPLFRSHQAKSKKQILLVDDNAIQLRALEDFLKEDYEVTSASSGAEALLLIGSYIPDLILLDYEMPVCNGKIVFETLLNSEATRDIPVIFLTGVNDKEHIKEVLALMPEGYLLKPVTKQTLLETIENTLNSTD